MKAHGKVHKYGDNVDTDVIIRQDILIQRSTANWRLTVWKT